MAELPVDTALRDRHYTVGPVLGLGNFGITYEGHDLLLNRRVAIKELYPSGSQRQGNTVVTPPGMTPAIWEKAIASFVREATLLGHLDNPAIVSVYDYFNENNTAYMVMKFISGITLDKYVAMSGGRLPEPEALAYTAQVGQALMVLHAANILHRDVKPSNIMRASNGQVVLIDFGSAREFATDRTVMQTAFTTRGFTAPEQLVAFGRKGPYTDVYALAATCYYLLSGRLIGERLDDRVASPAVMAAIHHGLADNPAARPQTIAQFLDELYGRAPAPAFVPAPPQPAQPIMQPQPPQPQSAPPLVAPQPPQPTSPAQADRPPLPQPIPPTPPAAPEAVDATTTVPEYLINADPAAPHRDVPRTVVISDPAAMPPAAFSGAASQPPSQGYAPPNQQGYPPAAPGYVPPFSAQGYPPQGQGYPPQGSGQALSYPPPAVTPVGPPATVARRRSPLLLILVLIVLIALIAAAAWFIFFNKSSGSANSSGNQNSAIVASPTVSASPTLAPAPPSPTLAALVDASPTQQQEPTSTEPSPTDQPAVDDQSSPTAEEASPTAADTVAPPSPGGDQPPPGDSPSPTDATSAATDTAPAPTVAPPVQPSLPTSAPRPRPTLRPRPTNTHPPAPTRVPPTATHAPLPPTATPVLPPPNPTTTSASQLGAGWTLLGHPNFNSYCAALASGATARATGGALSWACYSAQGAKAGAIDMNAACQEQNPNFNLTAQQDDPTDPHSWYCYHGSTRVKLVNEDAYCQHHYPNSVAGVEGGTWYCFQPRNIGPINVNTACVNQYGPGAVGYWGSLNDPNSWNCYRRQLYYVIYRGIHTTPGG